MKLSSSPVAVESLARPDAPAAGPSTSAAAPIAQSPTNTSPLFTQADVDAMIAAAVADAQPKLTIRFTAPPARKPDAKPAKTTIVADARIFGAVTGSALLASAGWALGHGSDRRLTVYAPSAASGFYRHVEPRTKMLAQPIVVRGVRMDSEDDPAAVAELERLNAAILRVWASNPGYDREVPLAL